MAAVVVEFYASPLLKIIPLGHSFLKPMGVPPFPLRILQADGGGNFVARWSGGVEEDRVPGDH